jgi:uncharacterized protein (TIGR01319 family)
MSEAIGKTVQDAGRFCIADVGSTTTKAILFRRDPNWRCFCEEVPTTVEKPHEDVMVGVTAALQALELVSGETLLANGKPTVPFFSTSSAGGGLAMVVAGLVREITAESADRVALGAGAIVLEALAMNDGRSPYRKIEDLKSLRPDMVLLAGGFDGDALTGPVFLAELLVESDLHPKLNPQAKMPLIYAGNCRAEEHVRDALLDRFLYYPVANIRPTGEQENYEPARDAIAKLFMDHVMSQAPGYDRLGPMVSAPVLPTPAGFAKILELASLSLKARILAVDVGGATTDVFTAEEGRVFRTVSANLGLSYSILNVAELSGISPVREFLESDFEEIEVWNRIGDKYINPTRLAETNRDMRIEWALATVAIREAVRAHLRVMAVSSHRQGLIELDVNELLHEHPRGLLTRKAYNLKDYGLIIGGGGILSHSPRSAAAAILVDALRPGPKVELAVDSSFMLPHLGVLGTVAPELARELFDQLGLVRLGTAGEATARGLGDAANYVPTPRAAVTVPEPRFTRGLIRLHRELAIPGHVLVKPGDKVVSATIVARSTREFLRPFFLHVAEALRLTPAELPTHMKVKVGDEIGYHDAIASRPRKLTLAQIYHSPVEGRVEKILPSGVVVVREKPEHAREVTTIKVAEELDIAPHRLQPYLRVEVGEEVEREQWLAAIVKPGVMRLAKSPVRGRVVQVDLHAGTIRIEPLLEEKEVRAWLPGTVAGVHDRGCVVTAEGVVVKGVWGTGGEAWGTLVLDRVEPGMVTFAAHAGPELLTAARERNAAGIIAGGVNLHDVLQPNLGFTLVVLEGFGSRRVVGEVQEILQAHEGKVALVDGTTRLRVGVQRPVVILPD